MHLGVRPNGISLDILIYPDIFVHTKNLEYRFGIHKDILWYIQVYLDWISMDIAGYLIGYIGYLISLLYIHIHNQDVYISHDIS